ncbi:MAG: DnaD domain protein [Firmicutes bacterium]|nr:DnaD domain protein [Bacillota bacterium]
MDTLLKFIDEYMGDCPKSYFALVYIYGFRKFSEGKILSTIEYAKYLKIETCQVEKALKYWEEERIINVDFTNKDIPIIEFLPLGDSEKLVEKVENVENVEKVNIIPFPMQKTPLEFEEITQNNAEIKQLFDHAIKSCENIGIATSNNMQNKLYKFYKLYNLPIDVIITLVDHCVEHSKKPFVRFNGEYKLLEYMEEVAKNWCEEEISTVEDGKNHLQLFERNIMSIMKAYGSNKKPGKGQRKFIDTWLEDWQMPIEVILAAWDSASLQEKEKYNFRYVNKIIQEWHEKGIKTVAAVEEHEKNWKSTAKSKSQKSTAKRSNYADVNRQKRDYEKIENLELNSEYKRLMGE